MVTALPRKELNSKIIKNVPRSFMKRGMKKQVFQDQPAFILFIACLKTSNRFQRWREVGILEKNGNYLQIKDEYKLSWETWDDLYYDV